MSARARYHRAALTIRWQCCIRATTQAESSNVTSRSNAVQRNWVARRRYSDCGVASTTSIGAKKHTVVDARVRFALEREAKFRHCCFPSPLKNLNQRQRCWLGMMGADHAFYYERARVLLPFRTVVRAHLIQTNFLTSRVGSGSSHSPLPGHFRLRRIISSDEERDYRASSGLHRSSAYSQPPAEPRAGPVDDEMVVARQLLRGKASRPGSRPAARSQEWNIIGGPSLAN
jgi:hypothetical protein